MPVTEDQFTPPGDWCPSPSLWHADDAHATEHEVTELVAGFVRALQPAVVAETGSYLGQTAKAIGVALRANGHGHLWTVEIDRDFAEAARTRLAGLPVTVVCANSADWDPPDRIGFAWVDGSGDRAGEIRHLLPRMLPGAIIGMHDAGPQHPYLAQVAGMAADGTFRPVLLRTPRGVMFAEVLG